MPTFAERIAALKLSTAKNLLKVPSWVAINRLYQSGDYWQNANAWVGPPVPGDLRDAATVLSNVQKDFTPIPLIEEVVSRHVTGLLGREPSFEVALDRELEDGEELSTEESALLALTNSLLTSWWDSGNIHELIQDLTASCLYAGRAPGHLFVPRDRVTEQGEIRVNDLDAAIASIFFDTPLPEACGLYLDTRTMQKFALFMAKVLDDPLEVVSNSNKSKEWIEKSFVEDTGQTVLIVQEAGDSDSLNDLGLIRFDADGELLVYDLERSPLISEPVRRMQNTINMMVSMLPRNAKYAGHRERTFIGVDQPDEDDASAFGAGKVGFFQASVYEDSEGKTVKGTPTLIYGEPVDSTPIQNNITFLIDKLLGACNQRHVLISGDATASAVSRVQARAEFADSLLATKPKVEGLLRWLLKTVLLLACHLANDGQTADAIKSSLRIRVDLRAHAGPLAPDEVRVVLEQFKAGLLSRETAMVMLGVEDCQAELAKLEAQPLSLADQETKAKALMESNVPPQAIWKDVWGMDDTAIETMQAMMENQGMMSGFADNNSSGGGGA